MDDRYWVKLPPRHNGALGGIQIPVASRLGRPMLMAPWNALVGIPGELLHPFVKHPDDRPLPLCIYCC